MRGLLIFLALGAGVFAVDALGHAAASDPTGGAGFARSAVAVLILVVVAVVVLGTWEGRRR